MEEALVWSVVAKEVGSVDQTTLWPGGLVGRSAPGWSIEEVEDVGPELEVLLADGWEVFGESHVNAFVARAVDLRTGAAEIRQDV